MKRTLLRAVAAVGALVALVSGIVAFTAGGAQAASILTFTGLGQHATVKGTLVDVNGVARTIQGPAGEMLNRIDGVDSQGYCIDITHGIGGGAALPEIEWEQMPVTPERINSIAWILNHYYPQSDPAFPLQGSTGQIAASVQSAIWHYSDNFELAADNDPVIAGNYAAILASVPLNPDLGQPITSLKLVTANVKHVAGDIVPVTVSTTGAGKIVNVVVTGGERVDASGVATDGPVGDGDIVFVRSATAGAVSVAVDARAEVQKGRIFRTEGIQAQILARSVTVDAKAAITLEFGVASGIRIVKKSWGTNKDAEFTFSVGAPGLQAPVLKTLTYEGTLEWRDDIRPDVAYEVREHSTDGWWMAPQNCDGGDATLLPAGDGFLVTPKDGQLITCEFHNVQPAKIEVEKRVVDSTSSQTFDFTLDDGQTAAIAHGETKGFVTAPGTKTVAEKASAGWTLVESSCTNTVTGDVVTGGDKGVSVTVESAGRWHCLFVNRPVGVTTTTAPVTTTTAPATTTTAPVTTTTAPATTTTAPTTTAPATTITAPTTTATCDDTKATETTDDDCDTTEVLGVRESRGTLTTVDTGVSPGRLARTGSNRTMSYTGMAVGLMVMGLALHQLSRSTTVTPSFVYIGGRKIHERRRRRGN